VAEPDRIRKIAARPREKGVKAYPYTIEKKGDFRKGKDPTLCFRRTLKGKGVKSPGTTTRHKKGKKVKKGKRPSYLQGKGATAK